VSFSQTDPKKRGAVTTHHPTPKEKGFFKKQTGGKKFPNFQKTRAPLKGTPTRRRGVKGKKTPL